MNVAQVEEFLYTEADLLDSCDLKNWMNLYTEDGTYWMPVRVGQEDPLTEISILYENRTLMAIRSNNFGHRLAPSMDHPVRCSHILSRIRVLDSDSATGDCTVQSNFQAVVYYKEQTIFAGKYTHQLKCEGDRFLIKQKRVDLINCDANHRSLLIYV
jgi:benzoate/toluate 1,2-dioxygenase subunit beta